MITFRSVTPVLFVSDFDRAIRFWTDVLGFEVTFINGNPPCFGIFKRDGAAIHVGVDPEKAGTGHCHFMVEGVDDRRKKAGPVGGQLVGGKRATRGQQAMIGPGVVVGLRAEVSQR